MRRYLTIVGAVAASVAAMLTPSMAQAKTSPLVLLTEAEQPLAVNSPVSHDLAVYYWYKEGEEEYSSFCTYEGFGVLQSNSQPKDVAALSGESYAGCGVGAGATGAVTEVSLSSKGTVTIKAKPKLTITHEGCTYETAKLTLTLDPVPGRAEAAGSNTFKLDRHASAAGCAATKSIYSNDDLAYEASERDFESLTTSY